MRMRKRIAIFIIEQFVRHPEWPRPQWFQRLTLYWFDT